MVNIKIDTGENVGDVTSVKTMGELVELVKSTIDPMRMITSITLNGQAVKESDWRLPLSIHGNGELAFETSSKEDFLEERIKGASGILETIIDNLSEVANSFRNSDSQSSNQKFSQSLEDLEAFIHWYLAVVEVDESIDPAYLNSFTDEMDQLSKVCDGMIRKMMTGKWTEVATAIDVELTPKLERIKLKTLEFSQGYKPH